MKSKIIYILIAITFGLFLISNKAKTAPNYSYNPYTSKTYSFLGDKLANSTDEQIEFIVDFSNSMNETIGAKSKLDMARTTIAEILPKIPNNIKLGLRVYGHKAGFTYLQGCQASKLQVPITTNNRQEILNSLYSTQATGWTPITYSLKQAINNDFIGATGKKHIILLSDGGENCDESPCTYVINLMKQRDDVTIDVIAFDVHDMEANNQLKCTALMTRGKYLKADNENDLYNSLFESVGINKDVRGSVVIPQED